MASIYHVRYDDCTDVEPSPGWYVGNSDDEPVGPFPTKTEAQDWAEDREALEVL